MVLSDHDIKAEIALGRLVIDPYDETNVQPASVDVRLGGNFRIFRGAATAYIDPLDMQPNLTEAIDVEQGGTFMLQPGQFALGTTLERIVIPDDILGKLEGKSTLGRLGLMIHSTAGYVDPGWDGELTLELSNVATLPIMLHPGMRIGQMSFERMTSPVDHPYGSKELGSHYQGQRGATASRALSE
ncbi:MAG: dCTP deaminase [Atopobiaceae bacterium]|jgi:dCTP deaminase|nr:dCTP deaminase [Atopobiaceae bacterium]MCH4181208.1 dCTP deaminase [Atopobiaceae bacterium]MCH4214973.1 dCTP deaminase [Atopobiaceae bacterium]MCH4230658.1 dCTP deaminase [Atopobiaceae bacterium]MCH4277125.1 dCTP deaminase [Atopobiaceae bacterium]